MDQLPIIGLALGGGSARGWSHIGVIRVLQRAGIEPQVVCGTSIGALVGAAYAGGQLDWLESWVRSLTWQGVLRLLDITIDGGLIRGDKLFDFFRSQFHDQDIGALPKRFGAVATDLATGREIWLREGSVVAAVRASIAMPGLFTPAQRDERLLVDGGLVNPVPVSLCRAMGADIAIAVDLNRDLVTRRPRVRAAATEPAEENKGPTLLASVLGKLPHWLARHASGAAESRATPSMLDVLASSLNIMQVRITSSRLAGDPADVMIYPRLGEMALMDYHRAAPAIAEGARATELMLPALQEIIGNVRVAK
ncbi:MAG TPA: patatin-like phospholipase RssA [Burkholderiales bacterium]